MLQPGTSCPLIIKYFAEQINIPETDRKDLYEFDPDTLKWTNLDKITIGKAPLGRFLLGFIEADGLLYSFGGQGLHGASGGQESAGFANKA